MAWTHDILVCHLIEPSQSCGDSHNYMGPPPWTPRKHHKKLSPYSQVFWRPLLNWGSLLSDDYSLCQDDKKYIAYHLSNKNKMWCKLVLRKQFSTLKVILMTLHKQQVYQSFWRHCIGSYRWLFYCSHWKWASITCWERHELILFF